MKTFHNIRLNCKRLLSSYPAARSNVSYDHGQSNRPFIFATMGEMLRRSAEKCPDRDLFVFTHQRIRKTNEQFYEEANKLASGFVALGLKKSDRLGIWSPNYYEWVLTQYAAAIAGLILVNVNPAYKANELQYCLQKVNMKAIIFADKYKTQNFYETLFQLVPELATQRPGSVHDIRLPHLQHLISLGTESKPGCWSFDEVFNAGDSDSWNTLKSDVEPSLQPDDACNIQFTSGTTGTPKGATLSHLNIVNNAYNTGLRCGFDKKHANICLAPPLYHCFGCVLGSLVSVVLNCTLTVPCPTFAPVPCLEAIEKEKCTELYGTPTMFIDILHHANAKKYDLSSLNGGVMAGAPCPEELAHNVIDKLGMKNFTIGYGTTECSPITHQCHYEDSFENKTSSIGRVGDHVEAKIVDDRGHVVPRGTPGELYFRGYMTMLGYWNDEEKTKEAIGVDRWYHSGDLAVVGEDGYTKIVGRIKDMIVRGGENVYPTEIEQCLFEHPDIHDAQVVGVPDERLGEEICAWVRLADGATITAEDLKTYCRERISHFKVPKYIIFKRGFEFPVTVTGKVQKYKMQEQSKSELGLTHVAPHMTS